MAAIEIAELRSIVNAILDHISNDLNIKTVDIDQDFYWNVDSGSLYEASKKPPETDLGSLHDDLEFAREILGDKDQAVALMLVHVAPLLRYVGEKIGQ